MPTFPIHIFFKIELFKRNRFAPIRQATQRMRQHQGHVARIIRLTKGLPLGVFDGIENLGQIAWLTDVGEALKAEQRRGRSRDQRRVRRASHMREFVKQVKIFGMP